ncbi:TrkA family potassium uptake protein [Oceanobacillus sp. J11TS1]|uniref:potassium channel family protein n=1 Tax=Oceanobacillus sp. J11TS1 TaxID=2807191 RepID=UPI001B203039|nr:potassium channel family protein [Oceanobacillus sp. J11TS1]GIO24931.1 putative potassium channel protein YugO [Oceanobacillus sp. J11TS1]
MNERFLKLLYHRIPIILKLLLLILITMPIFGYLIALIEPERFPTILDGIWWALITGSTVGYGDHVPVTILGRLLTAFLILSGGGLIAFYIASLSTTAIKREKKLQEGKIAFHGKNHYIFIGYNERTRQLVDLIMNHYSNKKIVIIDRTLNNLSYTKLPVHYIRGNATEDAILHMANVKEAACVFIAADSQKSDYESDTHVILTTIAIRGNNQKAPIISEILSKKQIDNAARAGATTILRSNDFLSSLFFHELDPKMQATPFEDIHHLLIQQKFCHHLVPNELIGKTFTESFSLLSEKGYLPIGVLREKDYMIHPNRSFTFKEKDTIITITNR